jgi:hypothetical protein
MARRDFALSVNRRRLLTSAAAAVTASGVLPGVKLADAAAADVLQSSSLMHQAEPATLSAATARRLTEIARRNEIRREANLPLLLIPKELRRMKDQEKLEQFERFEAAYGKAVWQEVLKPRREAEGNPYWRPSWTEGVRYQTQVNKNSLGAILRGTPRGKSKFRRSGRPETASCSQNNLIARHPRRPIELTVAINARVIPAVGQTRSNSAKGPR